MKNTGIVYSSTEKTPVVLPELAGLLPPLSGEQLAILEEDLRENGCYSPLIVDENLTVIDGHNRQALCEKHGIPYQMRVFHFDDTLEAMKWAVDAQKGRRNLDKWELGKIALKLKPALEAKAKANMSAGGGYWKTRGSNRQVEISDKSGENNLTQLGNHALPSINDESMAAAQRDKRQKSDTIVLPISPPVQTDSARESAALAQNVQKDKTNLNVAKQRDSDNPFQSECKNTTTDLIAENRELGLTLLSSPTVVVNTRKEMADAVGIGQVTMGKVIQIDKKAPQAVKDALDRKEISVNQAYQITRQIQELPEEERAQAARLAVEEEKIRKKLRKSDAETDRRAKISGQFCKAFGQSFDLEPTEENIGYWVDFCRMGTREIKESIDEARALSRMYASIEKKLRAMYPNASVMLDAEDSDMREKAKKAAEEYAANE